MRAFSAFVTAACALLFLQEAVGQIQPRTEPSEDTGLEEIYDQFEDTEATQAQQKKRKAEQKREADEKLEQKELSRLSELSVLSPFQDFAVIQKRFLPKTKRFELSGSGLISTNNAFFNNLGISLQGAFYFNEKYGIEGEYIYLSSSARPITEGLQDNQDIDTKALVQPESFIGAHFKWVPLYGKVAWFQKKIIPFDLYFTPGVGISTTALGGSESTISLGVGQLFALDKSYGVRWDFKWNYYQADVEINGETQANNHSDLLLSVGFSYFIPEATYR